MIRSAVTVSLVPQAQGGPFVFWGDLETNCAKAAKLGFAAVEIFPPSADFLDVRRLEKLLKDLQLKLAAMGTGAGWVLQKLRLTDPAPEVRQRALQFATSIIDYAGRLGAPAIIGSMQGRFEDSVSREQALFWLRKALEPLAARAHTHGVPLLFEPLNRYESNLINGVADGVALLESLATKNVKLLCDLFHMNIEEISIPESLRAAGSNLGHVHFVDSNRRPAGLGHLEYGPIVQTLRAIGFSGYASAEALPYPSSEQAAEQTMITFKKYFPAS